MFSNRDCVFMAMNCAASGATYFGLVSVDSKSLGDSCPSFEDVILIVLIMRIYLLPIICIFKMGLDVCDRHGDYIDCMSLFTFVCLQLHYGIVLGCSDPACYNFLSKADTGGVTLLTVVVAVIVDLSRIAHYLGQWCWFGRKHVRMEGDPEESNKSEIKMLIPTNTMEVDELLAELDSDTDYTTHDDLN